MRAQGGYGHGFAPEEHQGDMTSGLMDRIWFVVIHVAMFAFLLSAAGGAHASSRIKDVDMAEESTEYAKQNILVQSGTAMLAQANQTPQSVLKLLQG